MPFTNWIIWVLFFVFIYRHILKCFKLKNPEVWANIFSLLTCGVILGCMSSTFSFGFLYGVVGAVVPSMFRFTANKKRDENADN